MMRTCANFVVFVAGAFVFTEAGTIVACLEVYAVCCFTFTRPAVL